MRGFSWKGIKKEPYLAPLYVFVGGALVWMTYSAIHGTQKPDIIWDHKNNPEPFNAWRNKQTKLWVSKDHSKMESQAPDYMNESKDE